MRKSLIKSLFVVLFIFVSASLFAQKASLVKHPEAMFWEINGTDKNGLPSKVYIIGTIHYADDNLYPLPEKVEEALLESDRFVGEISSEGWVQYQPKLMMKMMKDLKKVKESGRNLKEELTEEEREIIEALPGFNAVLYQYQPWVISQLATAQILSETNLSTEMSYDVYFINYCSQNGYIMDGLDKDISIQLDVMDYGDYDYQLESLKTSLQQIKKPAKAVKELNTLYKNYISHDAKKMTKYYIGNIKKMIKKDPSLKDYYDALLTNRNTVWCEEIKGYLDEGGTTFIFSGVGHYLGEESVFEMMRTAGYLE